MRFLLLIKQPEQTWLDQPGPQKQKVYEEYRALIAELAHAGLLVESDQCTPSGTARTLRLRNGETEVEAIRNAPEQLGGFFLVEVDSQEEALRLAARIPTAKTGSIEIWPISPRQPAQAG